MVDLVKYSKIDIGKDVTNPNHIYNSSILDQDIINESNITAVLNSITYNSSVIDEELCFEFETPLSFEKSYLDTIVYNHTGQDVFTTQKAKYNQRTIDGKDFYNDWRTYLYLDILNSTYTETEVNDLQNLLMCFQVLINLGDWKTARDNVQNTSVPQGIFDLTMRNKLVSDLQKYIDGSY